MTKGQCPTCRGKVKGWMPALSFDTIVWATALRGCFEKDDAKYYLERREGCGETAATEEERGSILQSCILQGMFPKHDEGEMSNVSW